MAGPTTPLIPIMIRKRIARPDLSSSKLTAGTPSDGGRMYAIMVAPLFNVACDARTGMVAA